MTDRDPAGRGLTGRGVGGLLAGELGMAPPTGCTAATCHFHFDVPANGELQVAVAGELVDGDGDGTADALQGATRMTKIRNVLRLQMDSLSLERQVGGAWVVVARTVDPSNSGAASSVLVKTPTVGFCEGSTFLRLYRIHQVGSVRWSDGTVGRQVQLSGLFRDRILNDDPDC